MLLFAFISGSLLNFPPKDDDHPDRDISLPLSYSSSSSSSRNDSDFDSTSSFPIQDRGGHFVDGVVNHIVELSTMTMMIRGDRSTNNNSKISMNLFAFYRWGAGY